MEAKGQVQFILDQLHAGGYPSAIAAGACIRDGDNDILPKDIDIYISFEDSKKNIDKGIEACLFRACIPNIGEVADRDVRTMYTMEVKPEEGELPVNFKVLKEGVDVKEKIELHDFGINQIGYDGEKLLISPSYIADKRYKTITLINCKDQTEFMQSMEMAAELVHSYPKHELIIPDCYLHYVSEALH